MSFYSNWYERSVCKHSKSKKNKNSKHFSSNVILTDLTPAQVTVYTVKDGLVYNLEFRAVNSATTTTTTAKTTSSSSSSQSASRNSSTSINISLSSSASSQTSNNSSSYYKSSRLNPNLPPINTARSRRRTRNFSQFSDTFSTTSATSTLSGDSLWDDWIVKFINDTQQHKGESMMDSEESLEEWIFNTRI
ncbi:hypothetical protein G9A89_019661 [Geosiphon pyriformis]|nr:hypothetical protein G9A89_019661 [Geosiphon pyriformis]